MFATRFMSNNLPHPGDALYGTRFVLMYENRDGPLEEWVARR